MDKIIQYLVNTICICYTCHTLYCCVNGQKCCGNCERSDYLKVWRYFFCNNYVNTEIKITSVTVEMAFCYTVWSVSSCHNSLNWTLLGIITIIFFYNLVDGFKLNAIMNHFNDVFNNCAEAHKIFHRYYLIIITNHLNGVESCHFYSLFDYDWVCICLQGKGYCIVSNENVPIK